MEIESKDVAAGGTVENPVFTERTIKGTARIQNNKTLLLASVATGSEVKGREGLPLLGLIPILGRLFTAPTRNNNQVDIVIAITPRVIRAPGGAVKSGAPARQPIPARYPGRMLRRASRS